MSETTEEKPGKPIGKILAIACLAAAVLAAAFVGNRIVSDVTRTKIEARKISGVLAKTRAIVSALNEFRDRYGAYPQEKTLAMIRAKHPAAELPPDARTSAACFRQLAAAQIPGAAALEFHITPEEEISAPGNGGRSTNLIYIANAKYAEIPIVITPMPARGQAVIGFADGSIGSAEMTSAGIIRWQNMDLLDPANPVWNGITPDVRLPE